MVEMATAGLLTCVLKLMATGLPEKMSVTMVLAAIRRLQQRDCPGFSPDSILITTNSAGMMRLLYIEGHIALHEGLICRSLHLVP